MKRSLLLLPLLAALAAPAAPAQDLDGPRWKPLSLLVQKPQGGKNAARDLDAGTRVIAVLDLHGQKIVAIDTRKSTLDFTDDKDTNLLLAVAGRPGVASLPPISNTAGEFDGNPGMITFRAPNCPAKGAMKVRLKGNLAV